MVTDALIEAQRVTFGYGRRAITRIPTDGGRTDARSRPYAPPTLYDVNVQVQAAEMVGLLGPNG